MQENKYYTPEIEEFHVGFEYEIKIFNADKSKPTEWAKQIWTKFSTYKNQMCVNSDGKNITDIFVNDSFRVKALDKEDIERLGWKRDELVKSEYYTILENVLIVRESIIHIFELKDYESEFPSFKGTMKNKSELRKIMEMLYIKK